MMFCETISSVLGKRSCSLVSLLPSLTTHAGFLSHVFVPPELAYTMYGCESEYVRRANLVPCTLWRCRSVPQTPRRTAEPASRVSVSSWPELPAERPQETSCRAWESLLQHVLYRSMFLTRQQQKSRWLNLTYRWHSSQNIHVELYSINNKVCLRPTELVQ